jgi:hypothetical protein
MPRESRIYEIGPKKIAEARVAIEMIIDNTNKS